MGSSLETIVDEHRYTFLALVTQWNEYEGLKFSYSPGILFGNENTSSTIQFAHHIEITYEFETGNFQLGPLLGVGLAKDDSHFLLGMHTGIDF